MRRGPWKPWRGFLYPGIRKGSIVERLPSVPHLVQHAAARFGDAPFLTSGARTETFAQIARSVACRASALRARGVQRGDRVLLAGPNGRDLIVAWLAAVHAGALPAAVNPALTLPELQYVVGDVQPRLGIVDQQAVSAADALASSALPVVALDDESGDAPLALEDVDPHEPAAIVYTSGTTSRPKGALVRHLAYTGAGDSMPSWIGLGERERLWAVLPFFHINAQAYSLMSALANGYELVVWPKFSASRFWSDAASLGVTEVNLIGAMLAILADQPADVFVPGALRTIYAAPALGPEQNRAFEARFGVRIVTGFGMSENTFGTVQSVTSRAKASSIGRPREHPRGLVPNALRIVKPDGEPARAGDVGELQFRNDAVTPGYWNAPEITAKTIQDGWLRTGDAGFVDADGDVILVGRYKEMIRRRGENIAPREVEDVLTAHGGVEAAAVIGVPSALTEEDVVACVIRAAGSDVDEQTLRTWCGERLAPFKVPARVVFRDAFPLTPTMRVAKDRLRAEVVPLLETQAR